jgi:hypothetical protein
MGLLAKAAATADGEVAVSLGLLCFVSEERLTMEDEDPREDRRCQAHTVRTSLAMQANTACSCCNRKAGSRMAKEQSEED